MIRVGMLQDDWWSGAAPPATNASAPSPSHSACLLAKPDVSGVNASATHPSTERTAAGIQTAHGIALA